MSAVFEHRETADGYLREIVRYGDYRVILCREGIQWILQRRMAPSGGRATARWRALGYFATRKALLRLWHAKTGAHCEELAALPTLLSRRAVQ